MDRALEQLVWRRANRRCESCQVAPEFDRLPFEIDHILSRKHGGRSRASSLQESRKPWIEVGGFLQSVCAHFPAVNLAAQ
jgi:hypothetical protein